MKRKGIWKNFHVGSTSLCHQHIRGHYTIYKELCKKENIEEHHWAVPRHIVRAREAAVAAENTKGRQSKLDDIFEKVTSPREFLRAGVLHAVAQLITCNDQVKTIRESLRTNTHLYSRPLRSQIILRFVTAWLRCDPRRQLETSPDQRFVCSLKINSHMSVMSLIAWYSYRR